MPMVPGAAPWPAFPPHTFSRSTIECIIVKRFDRADDDGSPVRIHQEDACQALGFNVEGKDQRAKYESHGGPTLAQVASVLVSHARDRRSELPALLDQVTFTVAIGNADHHAKNDSFLHETPDTVTLAPLYDTVPTALWTNLNTRAAMSIGAAVDLPDVTAADLIREAHRWGLPKAAATSQLQNALERLLEATLAVQNSGELDVTGSTHARTRRLLDSLTNAS